MKLIVVIPTYNEAGTIADLLRAVLNVAPSASVLVVDDASPDGTADLVEAMKDPRAMVLRRAGKKGLGSAYKEGFACALEHGAEAIVQMDADFSHNPNDIARFLPQLQQNDLVIGSRYIPGGKITGWGPWRHFCSRSAMVFARTVLRLPVRDVTSGFRLWRTEALRNVLAAGIASEGYAFQEEMLYRATRQGLRITEVAITFQDRRVGVSKLGWSDVTEFFQTMLRLTRR